MKGEVEIFVWLNDENNREKAYCQIIRRHSDLVVKLAHLFRDRGISLNELILEGYHGLIQAAEKFNPRKQASFSTYAEYWIKHHMRRAIDNHGRTIRVPCSALREIRKIKSILAEAPDAVDITDSELAAKLGISEKRLRFLLLVSNMRFVPFRILEQEDSKELLHDYLPDYSDISPEIWLMRRESVSILNQMLSTLNKEEKTVVSMFFGLRSGKPQNLEEVCRKTGMTMYRARKLRKEALDKLKTLAFPCKDDLQALLR